MNSGTKTKLKRIAGWLLVAALIGGQTAFYANMVGWFAAFMIYPLVALSMGLLWLIGWLLWS